MEQVQGQEVDRVEVFENDIELYLAKYCEEQGIDNMKSETQSVWNGALMYIRKNVFPDRNILKASTPLEGYKNNNYKDVRSNLNKSTCGRYDIDLLHSILDIYIYQCVINNKIVNLNGFSYLTGIDPAVIYDWKNGKSGVLSSTASLIWQKIHKANEESLESALISSPRPVGAIAALNHWHGWSSPYTSDANKDRKTLTSEDVRALLSERGGQIEQKGNM